MKTKFSIISFRVTLFYLVLLMPQLINSQDLNGIFLGGIKNDFCSSICKDKYGRLLISGTSRNNETENNDVYIIRLNERFNIDWMKMQGNNRPEFAVSSFAYDDGYLVSGKSYDNKNGSAAGNYLINTDFNGNIKFDKTYGEQFRDIAFDVLYSSSNEILLLGYTRFFDPRGSVKLMKIDENGNELWSEIYGEEYDEYAFNIIEDFEGNYVFIGSMNGFFNDVHANFKTHDADLWIVKTNKTGDEIFNIKTGGNGHDFGKDILETENGYLLLGSTQSYGNGSFDITLMEISFDGDSLWQTTYGGEDYEYGNAMCFGEDGEIFIIGTTASYSDNSDIILLKTDSFGELMWQITFDGGKNDYGESIVAADSGGCYIVGNITDTITGKSNIFFTEVSKNGEVKIKNVDNNSGDLKSIVYPNPVNSMFPEFKIFPVADSCSQFQLYTDKGQMIYTEEISQNPLQTYRLGDVSPGVYIYNVIDKKSNTKFKGSIIIY